MSIHRSLSIKGKLARQRNVFSRAERLEMLKKAGRWKDGQSVYGLPKVQTAVKVKKAKAKKEAAAEGAAPGAAPAAGAAPPAGKPAEAAKKPEAAKGKGGEKKK